MSDTDKPRGKGPRAIIEHTPSEDEGIFSWPDEDEPPFAQTVPPEPKSGAAKETSAGFFRRLGGRVLDYADSNPHTVFYSLVGLALGVLVLLIGFWSTVILAVFVLVGAIFGQVRDGKNGAVNFLAKLIEGNGSRNN